MASQSRPYHCLWISFSSSRAGARAFLSGVGRRSRCLPRSAPSYSKPRCLSDGGTSSRFQNPRVGSLGGSSSSGCPARCWRSPSWPSSLSGLERNIFGECTNIRPCGLQSFFAIGLAAAIDANAPPLHKGIVPPWFRIDVMVPLGVAAVLASAVRQRPWCCRFLERLEGLLSAVSAVHPYPNVRFDATHPK
jgi:hypothetical protein